MIYYWSKDRSAIYQQSNGSELEKIGMPKLGLGMTATEDNLLSVS